MYCAFYGRTVLFFREQVLIADLLVIELSELSSLGDDPHARTQGCEDRFIQVTHILYVTVHPNQARIKHLHSEKDGAMCSVRFTCQNLESFSFFFQVFSIQLQVSCSISDSSKRV